MGEHPGIYQTMIQTIVDYLVEARDYLDDQKYFIESDYDILTEMIQKYEDLIEGVDIDPAFTEPEDYGIHQFV